jgi:hypothetical protein
MDIGSIFLILGLAILVTLFVIKPLMDISTDKKLVSSSVQINENDQKRSILLAERDRILRSLQELEFDFALGKIPEEDYPIQRKIMMQNGADVIRSLDELAGHSGNVSAMERVQITLDENRVDGQVKKPISNNDPDISALIAARRRLKEEKSSGFCPQCGKPVTSNDKFCARCGTTL